ncbi:MAG: FAD-dependent oxidoreductase [Actinomycetota bacterium]|nr:FAD-dependent oxidoreductase [Actinomycetota bacterium]
MTIAVLGAGPAGIGAGYRLAVGNHDVVVLERAGQVGGTAGSFELAGTRVDYGSHRLHPSTDPAILCQLRQLLGSDLQRRFRNGRIRLLDRWIAFPLRPGDLVRRLPATFAFGAAIDAALAPTRKARRDTFAEVLQAQLGPALCEHFYFPYARKLWGREPQELSGTQARRRVSADSPTKLLRRVVQGAARSQVFWYPRRGYGQLWERLAQATLAAGGEVQVNSAVHRVHIRDEAVEVLVSGERSVRADMAWSTLPLTVLVHLLRPLPPLEVLAAADRLSFRAMVLVYLVLDTDRYTPYDAHYFPGPDTPVTRISEPKNYRESADDPAGLTVLCAEIPCSKDDRVWGADDAHLTHIARSALRRAELTDPHPREVAIIRLPRAYPIYDLGYDDAFDTLDRWLSDQPRLLTFGRQGLFTHDNSHHALSMGWAAVEGLRRDGTFDAASWASARARFEHHVVED